MHNDEHKLGKSSEDYLEAVLMLKESKGYARSVDIAEKLKVTKPSVSNAVHRLIQNGYLEMDRSGFLSLTDAGMGIASSIYQRHRTLAKFFEALGVDPAVAVDDACRIEHDISQETFDALCAHADRFESKHSSETDAH
mgnify:CR=1 FL=1